MRNIIILSAFIFGGCNIQPTPPAAPKAVIVYSTNLTTVKEELKKLPKADREQAYKQWAGASEYLKHGTVKNTVQFDLILGRVQSAYSWNREKYPALTNSVETYLTEKNYGAKKLDTETDKLWLKDIFDSLADAAKEANKVD